MAKLRNLLALMAVALHLTALLVPATAHATMNQIAVPHADMHATTDHLAQPDEACCATAGGDASFASDGFCAICTVTCASVSATLEAAVPLPFAHPSTSHLALAEQTLRSAPPEAALRPPKSRS